MKPTDRILGVDPGKLNGIVIMDANGEVDFWINITIPELSEFLNDNLAAELSLIICEEYTVGVRASKLKGSKNEASQAIGILKIWAQNHEIPIVFQQPSNKELGEKWSKITPNGQSHYKTHWIDSLNHVMYYLVTNHYAQPESEVNRRVLPRDESELFGQFPAEDPKPSQSPSEPDSAPSLLPLPDPPAQDEPESQI